MADYFPVHYSPRSGGLDQGEITIGGASPFVLLFLGLS
jgi:hypothetical protein